MINKFNVSNLRNSEHLQFIIDAEKIFSVHLLAQDRLSQYYNEFSRLRKDEETAMAAELRNAKIKEKGVAEHFRDKLHSKLFNAVKAILYDDTDPAFDAAQRVMAVIKGVGNPTRLSENAESAMLTTLSNKLAPYRADLEAIGAQAHIDKLTEANRHFMELEKECRDIASERTTLNAPSLATIRKQIDAVYRLIVNSLNMFITWEGEEAYRTLTSDLNILVEKYDNLLARHTGKKKDGDKDETVPDK